MTIHLPESLRQATVSARFPAANANDDAWSTPSLLRTGRVRGPALRVALMAAALLGLSARGQDATAPTSTSVLLQSPLAELRSTISELRIAKWKAPGPVRDEATQNVSSIDRDLQGTLPGLIEQADAAPHSVASAFAVYRNLDALYEVVLRVSSTADLAAPDVEATNLAHSLTTLDAARRALGDSITTASHTLETAAQQQVQRPVPAAPPPPPPTTTVVNDGPSTPAPAHRKAKPKPKATTPAPAPPAPQP